MTRLTSHHFNSGNRIFFGLMRQHRPVNHITNGIDIVDTGLKAGINRNAATRRHGNANFFKPKPICCRMPSNRNKRNISLYGFFITAIGRGDCQANAIFFGFGRFYRGAEAEFQTLLFGNGHKFLGDFSIHARQDPRQKLDDFNLGTKARPNRAKLKPDIACANHHHFLW